MASRDPFQSGDSSPAPAAADRRKSTRKSTPAVISLRFDGETVLGAGRNISSSGLYFITSDEPKVQVTIERHGREIQTTGRLVRVDAVSPGTLGVALEFDTTLTDEQVNGTSS